MQLRAFALFSAILYASGNSSLKMYSSLFSKYYGVLFPYFCNFTWLFNKQITWSWVCCMNTSRALQLFPHGWCCHRMSCGLTAAALNQTKGSMEFIGDPLSSLQSYFAFMRVMNLHFVVWPLGHSWGARELLSPWPHCSFRRGERCLRSTHRMSCVLVSGVIPNQFPPGEGLCHKLRLRLK